jgi:phospholipase/lecithinase/hemolysin
MNRLHSAWKALWLVAALLAAPVAFAAPTRLVVFGDSLSDPGNFYAAFGVSASAPYSVVPSAPYTIGGHHFTNGSTWVEQLARRLESPDSAGPALVEPGVYTNYAVGGARARPNAPGFPFYDLTTQVSLYLASVGGHTDPGAVHVVWFGGNDLRDALTAAATDPTLATSGAILGEAVQSVADNIVALWAAGARVFLVPNAPDLSRAPAITLQGAAAVGGALQLSAGFNAALGQALGQLDGLPGIRLIRLDDFALIDRIVANPESFDIENARTPCLKFGVVTNAICEEPEERLFWDGIHPTTTGHRIIARAAFAALTAAGVVAH